MYSMHGMLLSMMSSAIFKTIKTCLQTQALRLHLSVARSSLTEFFDDPKNYGESKVVTGRHWNMDELRLKSNGDLHKLWFVLYKERNMLYTMQENLREENFNMPSPERIDKVEQSMANLENVVRERNKAYWQLEVSPCSTGERPYMFRRDLFGRHKWLSASQHLPPFRRAAMFKESNGPGKVHETETFFRRYREMKRKEHNIRRAEKARYLRDLFRRFPDADADYIAELHPEFPEGYVQHLHKNHVLYDDPPRKSAEESVKTSAKLLNELH